MIRFFKYPGCKLNFVNIINQEINSTKCKIYIEPFVGSGAVLLNLQNKFDEYIINDINENIIKIYKSFRDGKYSDLKNLYEMSVKEFGNPGRFKESYYNLRNALNIKYANTNTLEEGFFYYFIYIRCINGMLRWGKEGFNAAFGFRGYSLEMSESKFLKIQSILKKSKIFCQDYKFVFDKEYDNENSLYFLDPPYIETGINYGESFNRIEFLELIKNSKGKIIYTDKFNKEVSDYLDWRYVILRKLNNIHPGKNRSNKLFDDEVFWTNIEEKYKTARIF